MKQAILIRQDLKLPKGKLAAQVAHASVQAVLNSPTDIVTSWKSEGMAKIVLKVKDKTELLHFLKLAKNYKLIASLITDAGKTVIAPGTITCLGIGPDDDSRIDKVIKELKLL